MTAQAPVADEGRAGSPGAGDQGDTGHDEGGLVTRTMFRPGQ